MGKRSDFERIPRDYYPTPYEAVLPLIPHLPQKPFSYAEPCAGDGRLINHLAKHGGDVRYAYDLEPKSEWVKEADALTQGYTQCEYIITNPIESLSETIHKGLKSLRAYFVNANVEPQNTTKRDK